MELDFTKTALVLIDLQKGIVRLANGQPIVDKAAQLVKLFREKGGFVSFVKVDYLDGKDHLKPITDQPATLVSPSPDWSEFAPELDVRAGDHVVTKRQWGAFYGTDLDLQLRRRGVDTIALCGIATNIGVESTAREAFHAGYQQIFLVDAMAAASKEEHEGTCKYIFPKIGRIRTVEQFFAEVGVQG